MAWYHAIIWANVELDLYHHMAWPDYNELSEVQSFIYHSYQVTYTTPDNWATRKDVTYSKP